MKLFIMKLLFLASLISCENESPAEPEKLEMKLSPFSKAVRVNDTIPISLVLHNEDIFILNYEWTSSNGMLEGVGNNILFIAPEDKGDVIVKVQVTDQFGKSYKDSVFITVFKQFVILKADDLVNDNEFILPLRWKKFIDYVENAQIKASIGIIGNSLFYGSQSYINAIKECHFRGFIEFWNHGYDHTVNGMDANGEKYHEFKNRPLEFQREHISKTQNLAKKKLGFYFTTFGAPANGIDRNTLQIIEADSTIKVWFFGDPESGKYNLARHSKCEIEYPVHNPDYLQFRQHYESKSPFMVLQMHPNSWDDLKFNEFTRIIDYLKEQEVTFIKPYEYFKLMNSEEDEVIL